MSTYEAIRHLPLTLSGYHLEPHRIEVSPSFTRRTTSICLAGPGQHVGRGEDVNYSADEQAQFQSAGPRHELSGEWTLDSLSHHLDTLELFTSPPSQAAYRDYRRWAFESAALDLALQQSSNSLPRLLERSPQPLTFVASLSLGAPPTSAPVERLLERDPGLRFKLDALDSWDDELVRRLAELDVVKTVDLKGAYKGTVVDQPPSVALYSRVLEGFPDAWIEDPGRSAATDPLFDEHWDRVTWDAPIHSAADVESLEHAPRVLNVKPSRFGTLERLFDFYDYCAESDIELYGGGQFELAEGRTQIQLLASMFHPTGPNDVAPREYHHALSAESLPTSPLDVGAFGGSEIGFGRRT